MAIKRWIEVSFSKEGIHCYPAAATDPNLVGVSYLAHPHRHIFYFYVKVEVFHDDRDIEFILFKQWISSLLTEGFNMDYQSCEMLAETLVNTIVDTYPGRAATVKVYEDDENGAIIEYKPD
jgi:hypothetical protein